MSIRMSPSASGIPKIKIRSPKKDIKVYRLNYETVKKSPDILAVPGIANQTCNDDLDKITQAWNRLKINALSKAIAISPDVGPCSIGPKTCESPIFECEDEPDGSCDKLDLHNAVTSTPLKPKRINDVPVVENDKEASDSESDKIVTFDVSEIKKENEEKVNGLVHELCELEKVKSLCLNVIEEQVKMSYDRKRNECQKLWLEDQERLKEKAGALKLELDKERLLRMQKQYNDAQNHLTESKANALKKAEHLKNYQLDHKKKVAEANEKMKQIEQKRVELEEKQRQRREELKNCITGIHQKQVEYNKKYNQIGEIAKSCRNLSALNEKVLKELSKLKAMNEFFLKLFHKCEEGKVGLTDLKAAEKLVQEISSISDTFSYHADEINKSIQKQEEDLKKEQLAKEKKAKEELQLKLEKSKAQQAQQEEAERAQRESSAKEQASSARQLSEIEDCISGESLKWYLELKQFLEDFEEKVKPLLGNHSLKNFRFDCKKAVIVPVNAISPLDDLHLEDKLYKLSRLLQGAAVPLENSLFLVTGHPLGQPYCMNLLANKFVKQGEHTVSSKPEAAFAIAAVIVALWADFPDFGRLLVAHFHRECPPLIPAFLPQYEGQTNEDYYRQLGYQYSEDGIVEPQEKFLRRMSGVMRLYAAILVTPLKRSHHSAGRSHPHGIREAWRWLTATLNLPPRAEISATLIFDFLEVCGWLLYQAYGRQFSKLLEALCYQYFPLIQEVTPDGRGGPVVRLKNFLEKIIKERKVPPPKGLLPPNFW